MDLHQFRQTKHGKLNYMYLTLTIMILIEVYFKEYRPENDRLFLNLNLISMKNIFLKMLMSENQTFNLVSNRLFGSI